MRWAPLQWRFLASQRKVRQIRAGNQGIGKTTPMLAFVIGDCLGEHPLSYQPADVLQEAAAAGLAGPYPLTWSKPPEWWLVCSSWSQSLGIQEKLWELLPKDRLSDRTVYDRASGFAPTKQPIVAFRNGALIRIKTAGQDTIDFAGATLRGVGFDEPPGSLRMFTEALMRVAEIDGYLLLSYTPVNADTSYLQELVASGQLEDLHARLTADQLIPIGCTEPLKTKAGIPKNDVWIAEREQKVPSREREVVVHGEYDAGPEGAYFEGAWDSSRMVLHTDPPGMHREWLTLGIDHGDRPGKECAYLMVVTPPEDEGAGHPHVHVLDEYVAQTGQETPEDDARGILAMLRRHDLAWTDLRFALGDRVHAPGRAQQKSNRDLQAQIAKLLKVPFDGLRPQVLTAKRGEGRGAGSVGVRSRWLHHQMVRGLFTVSARCTRLIGAIPRYTGRDDDSKDPIDAIVYGCDRLVYGGWRAKQASNVRLW